MAKPNRHEQQETRRTILVASLVLGAGALLALVSWAGQQSEAIRTIDRLVIFNALWPTASTMGSAWEEAADNVPAISTQRTIKVLGVVSVLVMLGGVLGIVGAATRHKSLVCTHVLLASCLSAFVVAAAAHIFEQKLLDEPLIQRQVFDLCNATTFTRLGKSMACPWADAFEEEAEAASCNEVCAFRVDILRHLDGCEVLPKLCKRFAYELLDAPICADALRWASFGSEGEAYETGASLRGCREECDGDIQCATFAYRPADKAQPEERCLLLAGIASLHTGPNWTALAGAPVRDWSANSTARCFQRTSPLVLLKFATHSNRLVLAIAVLGIVLILSAGCNCCLMYNVNMKREGQPTGVELALMMLCPCCATALHRRFHDDYFRDGAGKGESGSHEASGSWYPCCLEDDNEELSDEGEDSEGDEDDAME